MRLYIETMDATLVEFSPDGRIRFDDNEVWVTPSVQERRAIIHAAKEALDDLTDLLQTMETLP
jgi:hypothetical protein